MKYIAKAVQKYDRQRLVLIGVRAHGTGSIIREEQEKVFIRVPKCDTLIAKSCFPPIVPETMVHSL